MSFLHVGRGLLEDKEDQAEVNVAVAERMARLHDALKNRGFDGHALEIYLVRLLFCLFADDSGIFPRRTFLDYVQNSKDDGSDLSDRIARLFEILNMPDDTRAKRTPLSPKLTQSRYINGGLFSELLPTAEFDAKMRGILMDCCHFDWNKTSPAIFGAMFTDDEKAEFLKKEPAAAKWFRPWIGADEFINGHTRHCLWLGECPPSELRRMPEAMKRVEAVRQFRLKSKSAPTRKLASTPCRFHVENMPETTYIAIPETSFDTKLQSFGS